MGKLKSEIIIIFFICILVQGSIYSQSFTEVPAGLIGVSRGSVAWGDYDNDGDLDILLTGYSDPVCISKVYRNDGGGVFTDISAGLTGVKSGSVAWGDFDNDGDLDILLTGYDGFSSITKLYCNDGEDVFTEISTRLTRIDRSSVAWGDYDNDGDLDVLLTGKNAYGYPTSRIFRNDGGGSFESLKSLVSVYVGSVAWGDYDNDGDLDILLTGERILNPFSTVYRNDGDGIFTEISTGLTHVNRSSVAWGDYDNDGDLDILLTGAEGSGDSGVSKVYRNDGGDVFIDISAGLIGVYYGSAAWGDYDNDGDLDVLLTGRTGSSRVSKVYRNDGSGVFSDIAGGLIDVDSSCAAWGDYDNDGDLDILLTGWTGTTRITKLYSNNTLSANTKPSQPGSLSTLISGRSVTFGWNPSTDIETPQVGLTYNIRVGLISGGNQIVSPMADELSGYRRVVQLGNTNHRTSWTINNLPDGIYLWGVQAIDHSFSGSAFAAGQGFVIDGPPSTPNLRSATPTNQQVTLKWRKNTDTDFLRYRIYGDTSSTPTTQIDSVDNVNDTLKTITGLLNGTTYYFRITALDNTYNESAFSNEKSVTPFCIMVTINDRWNLVSVPVTVTDNSKSTLFPTAVSEAYEFNGSDGYVEAPWLEEGFSYWLKFNGESEVEIAGGMLNDLNYYYEPGWNLIGSISFPLSVSSIETDPPGILESPFYEYNNGYKIADTLKPGKGYWIKVSGGVIILNKND